jgi:hypothetical protein
MKEQKIVHILIHTRTSDILIFPQRTNLPDETNAFNEKKMFTIN